MPNSQEQIGGIIDYLGECKSLVDKGLYEYIHSYFHRTAAELASDFKVVLSAFNPEEIGRKFGDDVRENLYDNYPHLAVYMHAYKFMDRYINSPTLTPQTRGIVAEYARRRKEVMHELTQTMVAEAVIDNRRATRLNNVVEHIHQDDHSSMATYFEQYMEEQNIYTDESKRYGYSIAYAPILIILGEIVTPDEG